MFTNRFATDQINCTTVTAIVDKFDSFNLEKGIKIRSFRDITKEHLDVCALVLTEDVYGEEWADAVRYTFSILKKLVSSRTEYQV